MILDVTRLDCAWVLLVTSSEELNTCSFSEHFSMSLFNLISVFFLSLEDSIHIV